MSSSAGRDSGDRSYCNGVNGSAPVKGKEMAKEEIIRGRDSMYVLSYFTP